MMQPSPPAAHGWKLKRNGEFGPIWSRPDFCRKRKRLVQSLLSMSTRGRTRTGTALLPMDFKSIVSTNSTTRALK
ncbi:uncharacterized protein METZ01_LOCUS145382, partial [marine metagenome]